MNAERLLAHYERTADAPDAILRLRRFVLDLAVRGKLVQQDPTDEPASELLKRIAVEKARLVKAGLLADQGISPLGRDEMPFELPAGCGAALERCVPRPGQAVRPAGADPCTRMKASRSFVRRMSMTMACAWTMSLTLTLSRTQRWRGPPSEMSRSLLNFCEASAAVNDVKRPSRFEQQRDCLFPFRSEQQARLVRPEVA
jgi:hypothetical protein